MTYTRPLDAYSQVEQIRENIKKNKLPMRVTGCTDSQKGNLIAAIPAGSRLVIAPDELKARELFSDYLIYDKNALYYPAKDIIFYSADVHGNAIVVERQKCIRKLLEGDNVTVFTSFAACFDKLIPPERISSKVINIDTNTKLDLDELAAQLVSIGYERVDEATDVGEFAIRGGIIDIFPIAEETPYRIEMWGDDTDIIKTYDPASQRSIANSDGFSVYPAFEYVLDDRELASGIKKIEKEAALHVEKLRKALQTDEAARIRKTVAEFKENLEYLRCAANIDSYIDYFTADTVSFIDYFGEDSCIFLDEPKRACETAESLNLEFEESMKGRLEKGYILPGQMTAIFNYKKLLARLSRRPLIMLSSMEYRFSEIKAESSASLDVRSASSYNGEFFTLVEDLKKMAAKGYRVVLLTSSRSRAERLASDLRDEEVTAFVTDNSDRELLPGEVLVASGSLSRGFEYPLIRFAILCETDIFGHQKKQRKKASHKGSTLDLGSLANGDYVVHENYGIGIYRGMEKVEIRGVIKDYVNIEYTAGGALHVQASAMDQLQKYSGPEGAKPKVDNLNSPHWRNTTARVKGAVKEIAHELVKLYAERQAKSGYCYSADSPWQKEFEEMFPYEETSDQLRAIADTKKDMESVKVMDRLICGDVGFGKTEVAIRAAFKAVQDGKQVAMLAPTTVLVQQHYNTFIQRMSDFAVKIAQLSRFVSKAEASRIISDLKAGRIDVVIGTHRLLSKDVGFKDLGLLIVDEEQRFGVTHKEKIKQLKIDIDVLTLSATPIPRTLHMSLIGIRDMSLLEEPPVDRLPIQTFVLEHNDELAREAIRRELARGGQVYYVFNKINMLDDITSRLRELIPNAVIESAHGQMDKRRLEEIMMDFINGQIDVLVSTTIIETGLDISNVNTIIIDNAENFGLAQLYQLRGRVGRASRSAYAFLMYRKDQMLSEVAEKRLTAIRNFTELGSGYRIAMRDLEIRGAGNLLGAQQSGHMASVGYDMYCKLLNEAVMSEKFGTKNLETWETSIDLDMNAHIPDTYIKNEIYRLDMYKRIASIENEAVMTDLEEEILDRYGDLPPAVSNLLRIALLKSRAHDCYITSVTQKDTGASLKLYEKARLDVARLPELKDRFDGRLRLIPAKTPYFSYTFASPRGKAPQPPSPSKVFEELGAVIEAIASIKLAPEDPESSLPA
ncbi:MAG: transcription-repair coupling factor [Lachnospiraceae bacterium]|nr:transcription-repair coupling factor [Lachnospiraceae bacterium]